MIPAGRDPENPKKKQSARGLEQRPGAGDLDTVATPQRIARLRDEIGQLQPFSTEQAQRALFSPPLLFSFDQDLSPLNDLILAIVNQAIEERTSIAESAVRVGSGIREIRGLISAVTAGDCVPESYFFEHAGGRFTLGSMMLEVVEGRLQRLGSYQLLCRGALGGR